MKRSKNLNVLIHQICYLVFLVLLVSNFGFSQDLNVKKINLISGSLVPEKILPQNVEVTESDLFNNKYFRLIQFENIPGSSDRGIWENNGLVLVDYLPVNTYFAVVDQSFDLNLLNDKGVITIVPVSSAIKMEQGLYNGIIPDHAVFGDQVECLVGFYKTLSFYDIISALSEEFEIIESDQNSLYIKINLPVAALNQLAALPYIQSIEPVQPQHELETKTYRNTVGRSNYLSSDYNGLNYTGDGVVIGIGEGGIVDPLDFNGRLTELSTGSVSSHKTGAMQNAGGAGNSDPRLKSNAWGATLYSGDLTDYANTYTSYNLRITNHSYGWGVPTVGEYSSGARSRDQFVRDYPSGMISYSSGNVGSSNGCAPYDEVSGFANITGNNKMGKNYLIVNNTSPTDEISFGSKGPTYDGRIKPDMVIEGWEGTSYASPKMVGMMAILYEVYKDKNSGTEPASSLIKAVMMNTCDDIGNSGPDFKTGYGRTNLRRAHDVLDNNYFITSSISNGGSNAHNITVPANTSQIRVMLYWADYEASVGAAKALVNDLDLTLTDPSSTDYLPWVLDHTADATNLDLPATRAVDTLNNVEQVTIDNPSSGTYTITVDGSLVPQGPQTYYIIYEFLSDELHLTYPIKGEHFATGNEEIIKWDSYGSTSTFDLDYKIDGGSWQSIASGIDGSLRNYEWTVPDIGSIDNIKVRISRDALTSESDTLFIGNVPENLKIVWAASDAVKLSWSAVDYATGYKIYQLGTKYMEEVSSNITFDGTSAVLTGLSTTEALWFAVSATDGINEGLRSNSIEKTVGDYNADKTLTQHSNTVQKNSQILYGKVNPHNTTLSNVHFEYGPSTSYGSSSSTISISATGHTDETVNATINASLTRSDSIHYRLVGLSDGSPVYGDDQEIRLAPGYAISLDGTDDYIDVSDSDYLPMYNNGTGNAYSVAMWVKGSAQNDNRIYCEGSSSSNNPLMAIGTNSYGKIRLYIRSDDGTELLGTESTTTAFDDSWHHITWVDNNGSAKLYIDGIEDATDFTYTRGTLTVDLTGIGCVLRSSAANFFEGEIDEVNVWNKALSLTEIRDLMHQPLVGTESGLKSYINLDGKSGAVIDAVDGTNYNIVGAGKIYSGCPFGIGSEFTAVETSGSVTFTGTDFEANYSSQNGATVIASKIEIEPNTMDGLGSSTIFDSQYWVVHRSGSGSFSANVTFTVSEDLTTSDQSTPAQIQLFARDKGSDQSWSFVATASSADATTDQATFNNISSFNQQFILARNTDPFISSSETSITFSNTKIDDDYQQASYELSGINLTENLNVSAPDGFQISESNDSGFGSSLSLAPASGQVNTTVYVRFTPSSAGVFSGDISNSSTGASTVNVNLTSVAVVDVEESATYTMSFDGSNDYLDITGFDWNPAGVFTIEFWLNPDSHNSWNQQIGNGWGSFLFHTNSVGMVSAGVNNNTGSRINTAEGALTLNTWHHFAFVLNGSNAKLYQNGILVDEMTGSDQKNSSWGHFEIGKGSSSTVDGLIDEFRFWSTARTEQEIRDNMFNVLTGEESGLKVYLQFNASTGNVLDLSTQGYTIESYNGPTQSVSTAAVGKTGAFVNSLTQTATGESGKEIKTTISVGGDDTNYLGIYSSGTGNTHIESSETFPEGINRRSDILWGIQEFGSVTADIVIDYSSISGVENPDLLKLLKRTDATADWTDVTADFVNNTTERTFSKSGETTFCEFSIGSDGQDNSLPVTLNSFTATVRNGIVSLNWSTESEIENLGYILLRSEGSEDDYVELSSYKDNEMLEGSGNSSVKNDYNFIDNTVENEVTYWYKILDVNINGQVTSHEPISVLASYDASKPRLLSSQMPDEFNLYQNYPNPFNPSTKLKLDIPDQVNNGTINTRVIIYNNLGQVVRTLLNGSLLPGTYDLVWDGKNLNGQYATSGIYYAVIITNKYNKAIKMVLMK